MYTIERKEKTNNNLFWKWFVALEFFVGVLTTLCGLTMCLVYIGG